MKYESPSESERVRFPRKQSKRHPLIEATETTRDRQTRNPSCAPSVGQSFDQLDHGTWLRKPPIEKQRSGVLANYGRQREVHNPYRHCVWDLRPSANTSKLAIKGPPLSVSAPALDTLSTSLFQADEPSGQEIQETFGLFYGYMPPVPGVTITESKDNKCLDIFWQLLGQRDKAPAPQIVSYFTSKPYLPVQHLVNCILDRRADFQGVWDLHDECIKPIRLRLRFGKLRRLQIYSAMDSHKQGGTGDPRSNSHPVETYYLLQSLEPAVSWKLVFISATAALTACRLPDNFGSLDIAIWFSQRGVPFRIFYPCQNLRLTQPILQSTPQFSIPVRPFNHIFIKEDYDSYTNLCTLLLGQPHMQAAMKRGGIIWRLLIATLGISPRVCAPPSQWNQTCSLDVDDLHFMDNILTTTELDLICGAYECVLGLSTLLLRVLLVC